MHSKLQVVTNHKLIILQIMPQVEAVNYTGQHTQTASYQLSSSLDHKDS